MRKLSREAKDTIVSVSGTFLLRVDILTGFYYLHIPMGHRKRNAKDKERDIITCVLSDFLAVCHLMLRKERNPNFEG